MKKVILTKAIVCLLFIVFFIQPFQLVHAAPSSSTIKKAYASYRKKKGITQYKLVDIDKNGIIDMIYYKSRKAGICSYHAKKKKAVAVKMSKDLMRSSSVYYNKRKHLFAWLCVGYGCGNAYVFKLKGTKCAFLKEIEWDRGFARINGKVVSEPEGDAALNEIMRYKEVCFGL